MAHLLKDLGQAGARGWRERIADGLAPRVAARTPAGQDQVKAAVGLLFVGLSLVYLVQTLKALRERR